MTLRQLKQQINVVLKNLEDEYGKNSDVDVVIYNESTDCLTNNVQLTVDMIHYGHFCKDITTFPYPHDNVGMLAVLYNGI